MNKHNEKASNRNCQQLDTNEGATPVAVAEVIGATLEDTTEVRDVAVVELDVDTPEIPLVDPVMLGPLRVIGEAVSEAVKRRVSVVAALANEAE